MKFEIISEQTFEKARNKIKESQKKINEFSNRSQQKGRETKRINQLTRRGDVGNSNKNGESEQFRKQIIFSSNDDELVRKILEKEKIDGILINLAGRKDSQKQRNSGFNQVFAKICQKNKIFVGINLDEILESSPLEKQRILARIKQNIKLCNKNKVQMKFIVQKEKNERNIYDLKSLGLVLGMSTNMIKNL